MCPSQFVYKGPDPPEAVSIPCHLPKLYVDVQIPLPLQPAGQDLRSHARPVQAASQSQMPLSRLQVPCPAHSATPCAIGVSSTSVDMARSNHKVPLGQVYPEQSKLVKFW